VTTRWFQSTVNNPVDHSSTEAAMSMLYVCVLPCRSSNIDDDVMATIRLVFRVSKAWQYSDNFVQDLLRAGLSSALHGKPMEVPLFGQISGIILLGTAVRSMMVRCLELSQRHNWMKICFCLLSRGQWEVLLLNWRWDDWWECIIHKVYLLSTYHSIPLLKYLSVCLSVCLPVWQLL